MFLSLMILLIPSLEDPCLASGLAMPFGQLDAPEVYAQNIRPIIQTFGYESPLSPPTLWHAETQTQLDFTTEELNGSSFVRIEPIEAFEAGELYFIHYGALPYDQESGADASEVFAFRVNSTLDETPPDAPSLTGFSWHEGYDPTWDISYAYYAVEYQTSTDVAYLKLEFSDSERFDDVISFYASRQESFGQEPCGGSRGTLLEERRFLRMTAYDLAGNASDSVSIGRVLEQDNESDDGSSEEGGQPGNEGEPSGCAGLGESWWFLLLLGALAAKRHPNRAALALGRAGASVEVHSP